MRILRIIPFLDYGGVEEVLALFCQSDRLVTQGIETFIIVLGGGGRIASKLKDHHQNLLILNNSVKIPNFRLILRLKKEIKNINPDVVHCQTAEANFHGILAAKLAGVPVRIAEEVGLPNHHSYWKLIFKSVYAFATDVIAISEAVKKTIVDYGEVRVHKVNVIYNPIDTEKLDASRANFPERYQHGTLENTQSTFITTCRLVPVKNLSRLLEAFAFLKKRSSDRTVVLWIVGDGEERTNLEQKAHDLGIHQDVRFFGYQENVGNFLAQADFFVLPSLTEGSSLSLAEAMYMGLPSIVTDRGGAAEILGNSESGKLVDPLDQKGITSAMLELVLLTDKERKEMGNRARKEAERFKVSNYMEELMKVYTGMK